LRWRVSLLGSFSPLPPPQVSSSSPPLGLFEIRLNHQGVGGGEEAGRGRGGRGRGERGGQGGGNGGGEGRGGKDQNSKLKSGGGVQCARCNERTVHTPLYTQSTHWHNTTTLQHTLHALSILPEKHFTIVINRYFPIIPINVTWEALYHSNNLSY
jgi:hypothetical protein